MNLDLHSSRTLLWPTAAASIAFAVALLLLFALTGAGSARSHEPGPVHTEQTTQEASHAEASAVLAPDDVPPGAVLLFRHAATDRSQTDADPQARGGCDQQRNLSADGVAQAERIGAALQQHPIGAVYASPFCRTLDTATAFGVGEVIVADQLISTTAALDPAGAEAIIQAGLDLVADQVGGDAVVVMVTHTQNIEGLTGGRTVDEGDAVVLVEPSAVGAQIPEGARGVGVLGVVPADAW